MKIDQYGKVAVLMGGDSSEREISLRSGAAVLESLLRSGVDACGIDPKQDLAEELAKQDIDRVFIMLHGRNGEDGKIQKEMEAIGMPYTGSGISASELTMNKISCKQCWLKEGLNTPKFILLSNDTDWDSAISELGTAFVKPVTEGSSIGIAKVKTASELEMAYKNACKFDNIVMAEEWVNGPEFTVGILDDINLPVIELKTNHEFYDYEAKYKDENTQYICPSELSEEKNKEIQDLSRAAYQAVGCVGWGRVDLMQDTSGKFWLLEVNTIPGMTDHSLVPMAAKENGIGFDELVLRVLSSSTLTRGLNGL